MREADEIFSEREADQRREDEFERGSASTVISTPLSVKPRVFMMPNSGVRSRADCIMLLPVMNSSMNSTAPPTERVRKPMSPMDCRPASTLAFSEVVRVGAEELANRPSIARADFPAARLGSWMRVMRRVMVPLLAARVSST